MFEYEVLKKPQQPPDTLLAAMVVLLAGSGLVMLFSASWFLGERLMGDGYYFFARQTIWALAGGLGAWLLSRLPLQWWRKRVVGLLIVTAVLMVLPLLPTLGRSLMGARRWITIGPVSFQPSELLKLTLVLYIANFYSRRQNSLDDPKETFLPPMLVVLVYSGLCLLQNDFSAAVFSFGLGLTMMYCAGLRWRFLLPTVLIGLPVGAAFLFMRTYRIERIASYFNPYEDPQGAGYQLLAARRALAAGGWWGLGPGAGLRKLGSVPEVQSDFIAAVIGEELGFFGITLLFVAFGFLVWRAFRLALVLQDPMEALVAKGIGVAIGLQFLLNMGVVSGALPATGVPLPFFSAGGSSLLVHFWMVGILLSLSRGRS